MNSPGVIITGATGTIGRALVLEFARRGWFTGIAARGDAPGAALLLEEARRAGPGGVVLIGDLAHEGVAERLVAEFLAAAPSVDSVINNAGGNKDALFYFTKRDHWLEALQNNLVSAMALTRAALPEMIRQRRGAIVNMSSISALSGRAGQTAYAAAKGGLNSFTRSLAREVGKIGIRVNAIACGAIDSPRVRAVKPEDLKWMEQQAALQRLGRAEEVATVARFLASEESSFITGQVIRVDGGAV